MITIVTVSAPAFVWAIGLVLVFAYFMPLFPITGRIADTMDIPRLTGFLLIDTLAAGRFDGFLSALHHLILPAFTLAIIYLAQYARLSRASMRRFPSRWWLWEARGWRGGGSAAGGTPAVRR